MIEPLAIFSAVLGAVSCLFWCEPGLRRLLRMKWNGYWRTKQRERMTAGFRHKRSPWFRDGVAQ